VTAHASAIRFTARRAWPADAETLVRTTRLGQETWRAFAPRGWTLAPYPDHVDRIRGWLSRPGAWALLASAAGEPAGHAAMLPGDWDEPRSAILYGLFVRPPWWGTGLADALHDAFLDHARAAAYPYAWLSTPAAHARARRFYERRGWRADTLLEDNRGLPMAVHGRPLLP
jgi:GNAT superfamily N-acetyltransferase